MRGNWIRVVRHCPDKTRTFTNDLRNEVSVVACYLARNIEEAKVSGTAIIFDDRDRQWVSCLIQTGRTRTKLNHKVLDYDGDMNFSDVSFRFKNTRVNVVKHRFSDYKGI